jgi:error-prone DNA polymerase
MKPLIRSEWIVRLLGETIMPNGAHNLAGCVIARQRPGTAHGFIFLFIEDETGIANAIVGVTTPKVQNRTFRLVAKTYRL